jgi:hypothetical protein
MLTHVSRLRDLLLTRGQGLVDRDDIEVSHYTEAKLDWESSGSCLLPPECDCAILHRFKEPRDERVMDTISASSRIRTPHGIAANAQTLISFGCPPPSLLLFSVTWICQIIRVLYGARIF